MLNSCNKNQFYQEWVKPTLGIKLNMKEIYIITVISLNLRSVKFKGIFYAWL